MTKAKSIGILAGILTAAATYTGAAHAEGTGYGSAALLAGWGFRDPAGFGLGARGGYTLPMNVYIGGTLVYHLGKSESVLGADVSFNVFYFGVEGGYDIEAGPVLVRPYLGLGDLVYNFSIPVCLGLGACTTLSESSGNFALWPGATVLYPIDNFFVGGDMRFVIATSDSAANVFSILATGGMKF